MTVVVRAMTAEDKPAVMRILRAIPEFLSVEVAVAEEVIDCYLGDPSGSGYLALVAEAALGVVGYVCYGPTPLTQGTWDIYWIAVAREQQGYGIGKKMLAVAEERMSEADARLLLVETSSKPEYEKTWGFYRSQGYEVICRIPDFYAPGDAMLVFHKRLR
ncbi:MAG: N-acetyltransferase [Chloroflexota bacterium]